MTLTPSVPILRRVGRLATVVGTVFAVVGTGAWCTVTKQLRNEKITVPGNAPAFAGKRVQGPATAYTQALVIKNNAELGAGGRTFSEITEALRNADTGSDEAQELRSQRLALSTAAALRTSLMTSVLAYGVSAFAVGVGAFFALVGSQFRRVGDK